MFNKDHNGYIDFYNVCLLHLETLAKSKDIDINDKRYKDYFDPLSDSHKKKLIREFIPYKCNINLDFKNTIDFKKYVFMRFVASWFNQSFVNYLKSVNKHELTQLLQYFDVDNVIEKYSKNNGPCGMYNEIITNPTSYTTLNNVPRNSLLNFLNGIYSIAELFNNKNFPLVNDSNKLFDTMINNRKSKSYQTSKNSYFELVNEIINQKIIDEISGMSWALVSDAIKESGLYDIAKPDIHIIEVFGKAFHNDKDYFKKYKGEKLFNEILSIFHAISTEVKETIYEIDKIIWLGCAHFYFHGEKHTDKKNKKSLLSKL